MNMMEREYSKPNFCLYIFSVAQDLKQANLVESLRKNSRPFNHYLNEMQFKIILDKSFGHVTVYRSETCGLGKSKMIKDTVLKTKGKPYSYVRIPLYGSLDRNNLIDLHF